MNDAAVFLDEDTDWVSSAIFRFVDQITNEQESLFNIHRIIANCRWAIHNAAFCASGTCIARFISTSKNWKTNFQK